MTKQKPSLKIKICCISSPEEARMAVKHGADVLGLVGAMPSGPGVITDEEIAKIVRELPNHITTYLLSSETIADNIIDHYNRVKTAGIQLVDTVLQSDYTHLREALPGVELVQVIHVTDTSVIDEARQIAPFVDRLLLDSGNPSLPTKELGGTGRTHNWEISRQIVAEVNIPVFLAGGLKETNVMAAIEQVAPFGLDLCSGVRTDQKLDEAKLARFMAVAKS